MTDAKIDNNAVPALIGTSTADAATSTRVKANPTTHRMRVDSATVAYPIPSSWAIDQQQTQNDTYRTFGENSGTAKLAQTFQPAVTSTLKNIRFQISRDGIPMDAVQLKVYSDGVTAPGSLLATSTRTFSRVDLGLSSVLGTNCDFFFTGITLSANTTYWAELSRTGTVGQGGGYKIFSSDSNITDIYNRGELYAFQDPSPWYVIAGANEWIDAVFSEYYLLPGVSDPTAGRRDNNGKPALTAVSNGDGITPVNIFTDPSTGAILIDLI